MTSQSSVVGAQADEYIGRAVPLRINLRNFVLIAALILIALGWLTTLQIFIGASGDPSPDAGPGGMVGPLMDDSGEFVVAWNTWGDTHPPGYPLLNFLANVYVRVYRLFGASPIVAASLVSFVLGLAALLILAQIVSRNYGSGAGVAAAMILPAFGGLVWLYSTVAETYSLGLLLGFASLALAIDVGEHPRRNTVLTLGFVFGLAVGHHRTLLALIPALAFAAWPALQLGWRVWIGAALLAVLALGVYVYLPIAALLGSPWIYGRSPATLAGLLDALLVREYTAQLAPPTTLPDIAAALIGRAHFLAREITWPGLVLGTVGLVIAVANKETRRLGIIFALLTATYLFAPVGQYLLIGTHLMIMVTSFALAGAWGLAVASMGRRWPIAGAAGLLVTMLVGAWMFTQHQATVRVYSRDPLGARIITAVKPLTDPHRPPFVIESWGPRYYALAYGKYATRELADIHLIDSRGNLELFSKPIPPLIYYTTQDFLYIVGPDEWEKRIGRSVSLSSAGDGIVEIRGEPLYAEHIDNEHAGAGDVALFPLKAWMDGGAVRIHVQMQAVRDTNVDYHVFVHISEKSQIIAPEDILAQGDRANPVYGFYPTSKWRIGEPIYDDYRISVPVGSHPQIAVIGLYTVNVDGSFNNTITQTIEIAP